MSNVKITISACIITYNQEKYIRKCLEGAVSQQLDFNYEIVISDDFSTDGTLDICKEFALKYPEIVKLYPRTRNLGMIGNWIKTIRDCSGKYISLCEGDDYWTDILKLQKQVDFLESNPEYGLCFHNVEEANTLFERKSAIIPNINSNTDFTIQDYILNNMTATCSIVFNRNYFHPIPSWFKKVPFCDLGLILSVLKNSNGKGHVLFDTMGVYRIHEEGIHGRFHKNSTSLIKAYKLHLQFYKIIEMNLLFEKEYKKQIFVKFKNTYKILGSLYKKEGKKITSLKTKIMILKYNVLSLLYT